MNRPTETSAESVDLSLEVAGLRVSSPLTTASGTFGSGAEFSDFVDLGLLGALTTKGVSPQPWLGNSGPRIVETTGGMLNSIGLQNPGVAAFKEHHLGWLAAHAPGVPVIVNVCGHRIEEFVEVIDELEDVPQVCAYELNISCPNVDAGGMAFGTDQELAARVVTSVRAHTRRPVFAKLTPNVTDIALIARAVEAAGADGVSLINTVLGMAINPHTRRARLPRRVGGLSGPAIKPIALRAVYEVARAVEIPLIGMGGVASAEDVIEFLLAGASLVALGTVQFKQPDALTRVHEDLLAFCRAEGITRIADIIGALEEF